MNEIIAFIKQNEYLIGIIGLVISGIGVFYGRKAYRTAQDIFKKGLQIDESKIFSQIGLEIIWGFIIPYSKFKSATASIWKSDYNMQSVTTVHDILSYNKFSVAFPYLDLHKGELWDALEHRKGSLDNTADSFLAIMQFYESAKMLSDRIRDLDKAISDYLRKIPEGEAHTTLTLADFFKEDQFVNDEMFRRGLHLMEVVDSKLKNLPKELEIEDKQKKLNRL